MKTRKTEAELRQEFIEIYSIQAVITNLLKERKSCDLYQILECVYVAGKVRKDEAVELTIKALANMMTDGEIQSSGNYIFDMLSDYEWKLTTNEEGASIV